MLSEKVSLLFEYLGCSNSDVARFAECSPSLISRLRTGSRTPKPQSPSVMLLCEGVYSFADKSNRIDSLCRLCNTDATGREKLIPTLIGWLFDRNDPPINLPDNPHKKSVKKISALSFGDKLNAVMAMLDLSNSRLARMLNVDNSHVSRFRNGVRSPISNPELSFSLVSTLLSRAKEAQKISELSALTNIATVILTDEEGVRFFSDWLYETDEKTGLSGIDTLLEHIDEFALPVSPIPNAFVFSTIEYEDKSVYIGINGLREAVIRFLSSVSQKKNNELRLYSD